MLSAQRPTWQTPTRSLSYTHIASVTAHTSTAPLDSPLCCVGGCGQLTRNYRPRRPAAGALSTYRPPPRAPPSPTQPSVARQHLRSFLPLAGQHTHAACGQHHSTVFASHPPLTEPSTPSLSLPALSQRGLHERAQSFRRRRLKCLDTRTFACTCPRSMHQDSHCITFLFRHDLSALFMTFSLWPLVATCAQSIPSHCTSTFHALPPQPVLTVMVVTRLAQG
jgi:hypothetical protein